MVRVLIEWHVKPAQRAELEKRLTELRTKAMRQSGYISGETLVGCSDSSVLLVISSWTRSAYWEAWRDSPERRELTSKIEPLLSEPLRMGIFASAAVDGEL